MARKVAGVGSAGTRCWIVLMLGRDESDPLFLQVKEAEAWVLSRFAGASKYANQGQRVVAGQQLMQVSSDIFLGWQRAEGIDGKSRDFYVRQLRDWKCSIDIEDLRPRGMRMYGELCGWALARAHACCGDRIAIAAYLGTADVFDQAITTFAARDDELICLQCGASVRGSGAPERSPSLDRSLMRSEFAGPSREATQPRKLPRAPGRHRRPAAPRTGNEMYRWWEAQGRPPWTVTPRATRGFRGEQGLAAGRLRLAGPAWCRTTTQ